MSQNAHTLHLFFDDRKKLETCQLAYQHLISDEIDEARLNRLQRLAHTLDVSFEDLWDESWFNGELSTGANYLILQFDTGPHDDMPLLAVETLFKLGMQSAVLEIFFDQVGEIERWHFSDNHWVSRKNYFERHPQHQALLEPVPVPAEGDDTSNGDSFPSSRDPDEPMTVPAFRAREAENRASSLAAAEVLLDLMRNRNVVSEEMVKTVKAARMLLAAGKGLLHAVIFTVITIVLFKGFWLWLGLGLALCILLPLYHLLTTYKELNGGESEANSSEPNE